ncbi:hypothetical protein ABZ722_13370 [Streptomyces longwoodensis]|uniref:hypothetical protein n=1 Tax=Streptomyces longwoodensis TaxID=68231 RepID=UPI0033DAC15C
MSHTEQPHPTDRPATVAELVQTRLADAPLPEPVKVLLKEALGDGTTRETSSVSRIYLESVAVTRFRGIGPRAWLKLSPRPGVRSRISTERDPLIPAGQAWFRSG